METVGYGVRGGTTMGQECQWGNPVLASDSDDSILFIAEKPLPSIQQPWVVGRASTGALPTFSSSASDTSSSLGEYWLTIFI